MYYPGSSVKLSKVTYAVNTVHGILAYLYHCSRVIKTPYEVEVIKYVNKISSMAHKEVRLWYYVFHSLHVAILIPGDACYQAWNEGV